MEKFESNFLRIQEKIAEAALKSGRNKEDITLVAATKNVCAETVKHAISFGINHCGENKVQEFMGKYDVCAYSGSKTHFIGNLQRNKVKYLAGKIDLIQSVSSVSLAKEISKQSVKAGIVQDILIEINISDESAKTGMSEQHLYENIHSISELSNIYIRGLMAIPKKVDGNQTNFHYFEEMAQLFVDIRQKKYDNSSMDFLSMGMSRDYYDAILCGSNMVRVGNALFEKRC